MFTKGILRRERGEVTLGKIGELQPLERDKSRHLMGDQTIPTQGQRYEGGVREGGGGGQL